MSVTRKKVSDLVGYSIGRLTVVSYLGKGKWDKHYWVCSCSCGGEVNLPTYRITGSVPTLSCGCLTKERLSSVRHDPTKHGLHKHPLYSIFHSMKQRCYNPNSQRWKYYGARGITICDEWLSDFTNFYNWSIKNGWRSGLSIDRLDRDLGYEPSNCEWITVSENSRRMNVYKNRK